MKKQLLVMLLCFYVTTNFSQDFKFGKVTVQELQEKFYEKDSSANAVYLYKNRNSYYDLRYEIKMVTEIVQRIKIYNKDGLDYSTIVINYYKPEGDSGERVSSVKAFTYNLVGGKIEKTKLSSKSIFDEKVDKNNRKKKITMPNVKEGSIIEIKSINR
jgi:hypothetical protein